MTRALAALSFILIGLPLLLLSAGCRDETRNPAGANRLRQQREAQAREQARQQQQQQEHEEALARLRTIRIAGFVALSCVAAGALLWSRAGSGGSAVGPRLAEMIRAPALPGLPGRREAGRVIDLSPAAPAAPDPPPALPAGPDLRFHDFRRLPPGRQPPPLPPIAPPPQPPRRRGRRDSRRHPPTPNHPHQHPPQPPRRHASTSHD